MVAKRAYAIRPYISRPMWWRYVQNANGSTGSDRLTAMDKPGHVPTSVSAAARLTDSLRSTTQWVVNVRLSNRQPIFCPVISNRSERSPTCSTQSNAGEISRLRPRNDRRYGTLPNRQFGVNDPLNGVKDPFLPVRLPQTRKIIYLPRVADICIGVLLAQHRLLELAGRSARDRVHNVDAVR